MVLAIYIIAVPLIPEFSWWLNRHTPIKTMPVISLPSPSNDAKSSRPNVNTLIVPTLNLKQPILDGTTEATLNQGLWHLPTSGNPSVGSNMVIAGHRFLYGSATPFYHLDKIKVGDSITIYWSQQRYDYSVVSINAVPPTATYVLGPTKQPTLTLFTCTPLWTDKQRLIISAKLTEHVR